MDSRKIDLVFFTFYNRNIDVDYKSCETIAKNNNAKEVYKVYSRSERMKKNNII